MRKATILIVDDEHANQFLLEGLLNAHGYDTLTASDGEECMELLKTSQPDLILLDIMMPRMSGVEVLKLLRKSEDWKHIPVLMVSAKTTTADIKEALELGAIDYIKKPFDELELLSRVKVGMRLKFKEDHLREMIRQREDFVKIISHDLRSPFTAINGFAELLRKADNLSEKQKSSLDYIIESVEFSNDYFNRLLSWTMLESNDLELRLGENNLSEIIESVFRVFEKKAKEKQIELIKEVDDRYTVKTDATFFRQVIANLVSNGIKFSNEKGQVKCSLRKKNGVAELVVSDNGIGIPEDPGPEQIFNDEYRKPRKGTKGEKGTGIGLSICRKLLDAHGFKIRYEPGKNGGSDFIISMR
jgi:signal transduction histidine kinase